jgi:hypothetical protein
MWLAGLQEASTVRSKCRVSLDVGDLKLMMGERSQQAKDEVKS